ncbi:hypothetical protein PR202_gb13532 [Eleusine coracana subsp. coracana]|uniref:Uncharacterized protein n=1 Tax=Eleusine coracana subsp. coracana TaxID=191504 RepID=A0AAV5EQS3_ELECO|nr:hypothetical protein PR202_gb13532 [Eleusine coracana subsp. coracana]
MGAFHLMHPWFHRRDISSRILNVTDDEPVWHWTRPKPAGTTAHHVVADGLGRCSFMLAWGKATRGIPIDPVPLHDRASIFAPRNPPRVEFEHRGVEFKSRNEVSNIKTTESSGNVVVHMVHFTPEMVSEMKSRASVGASRPYSSLQCVTAHLWRCITKARGLDRDKLTKLKIAVNGRSRMRNPRVPEDYAGNVVLWAQPTTTAGELLCKPLQCWAPWRPKWMTDSYFRSFIDFASSEVVEKEGLVPTETLVGCPDIFVSNLKGIPMYDLDFGTGRPFLFTRSHPLWEGYVFIMPPLCNDGGRPSYPLQPRHGRLQGLLLLSGSGR